MFSQSITPAVKSHLDAQFSFFNDVSKQLFNAAQKVNELNIQVAQTVMEESLASAHQYVEARNTNDIFSISASQAQPAAEKVRAYQQHLTDIAAGTQVELVKAAESHIPETSRTAAAVAEEVKRRASEETEKVTQRVRAATEKLTTPINKASDRDSAGSSYNPAVQGGSQSSSSQSARKNA